MVTAKVALQGAATILRRCVSGRDHMGCRSFASAQDIVGKLFMENYGKVEKYQQSVSDIPFPLSGDEKTVAKYAEKLDQMRFKAGMPSTSELIAQKLDKISTETPEEISQAEFFSKAESYREELGLPKDTFAEVGSLLKEMKTKLDASKNSSEEKKIAKEYREKLAAMEKKITVAETEEKAVFVDAIQKFVAKKKGDLMAELETLQKNHKFQTPASSFDFAKLSPQK